MSHEEQPPRMFGKFESITVLPHGSKKAIDLFSHPIILNASPEGHVRYIALNYQYTAMANIYCVYKEWKRTAVFHIIYFLKITQKIAYQKKIYFLWRFKFSLSTCTYFPAGMRVRDIYNVQKYLRLQDLSKGD